MKVEPLSIVSVLESSGADAVTVRTHAPGPGGLLPLTPQMLLTQPSGNLFGLSQNAGMGWSAERLLDPEFLILSTHGGVRAADGTPIALGFHTGHWEVGLLVEKAAQELRSLQAIPFAGACTDPCDGRSQGTDGMLDSLPYRNDAATVLRRLMRSLPTRKGVMGVATCDKGLPAMMMALASSGERPAILVPGGTTLLPENGEDAGKVQTIGARYAQQQITLEYAAEMGCRACASPGGGCQFLGTAATSQVVAEALGMALPHSALAPSGQPIWLDAAARSARALLRMHQTGVGMRDVLTDAAIENAMVLHAAFGGSTNLLLHTPAIAYSAGLRRPTVADWTRINREIPRLVDALPNGPRGFATVQVFLAGGVAEVMLHLRAAGLLDTSVLTVTGQTLDQNLDWWEQSERRRRLKQELREQDGIDADDVIMSPDRARERGLTATVCFPAGNLAPEGSVIKSTAIDASLVDADEVYRHTGPARVFVSEAAAIQALKNGAVGHGDVMVLICGGPMGAGMEEIYQVTSALKQLPFCRHVAVITDARFSGVSTGACLGHVSPEALAGGPVGRVREGDVIEIVVDRRGMTGTVNLVGEGEESFSAEEGARRLALRGPREDLAPHPRLPDDTRLWAALIQASGGVWGGCVYDTERIVARLAAANAMDTNTNGEAGDL
ncbi:YjhG/YagF family D-xylonate dehydratase [Paracidobacterium acidisoli]|uniref:YjhG/YagF family D-xylonate dehydratase n=1 Tax=Paracidobacterium acidisoli TaxID=2303751 RepID=A0A372ISE7_9BACT|nr:YjhG/YagF family D-xylonate dehydratase [Paracidobacterium acidisoli]MBT9330795.1 YjhG/YagF family D-xylonate dehydratase [Paracidobacterium acidisoli]